MPLCPTIVPKIISSAIAKSPRDASCRPIILVLQASNILTKFRRGHPLRGAKYRWGRKKSRFSIISRYISQTIQNIAIVTMEGEQELVCYGAISNDLERTNRNPVFKVTPLFDAKYLTNGYRSTTIVTIEGEQETAPKLSSGTNFNDLE